MSHTRIVSSQTHVAVINVHKKMWLLGRKREVKMKSAWGWPELLDILLILIMMLGRVMLSGGPDLINLATLRMRFYCLCYRMFQCQFFT